MPPAAQNSRSVFVPVVALQFSSSQADECRDFLSDRAAHTECVPVVDENQLLMSAAGTLSENGYRFNSIGFDALAKILSAGLLLMFNELAGETRHSSNSEDRPVDIPAAVGIYNTALRVRFDAIRERTLLVNHAEQAIEGFLGLDHRMLENTAFFDMIRAELESAQPQAQFFRAEIIGRELRVFYIDPTVKLSNVGPNGQHFFAPGWYFSNREDGGYAAKATLCLFTRFGPAIESATKVSKLIHMGSDILGRASVMVRKAASRTIDMAALAAQIEKLSNSNLGATDDKTDFNAALQRCSEYLHKLKIPNSLALELARNALLVGCDAKPKDLIDVYTESALKRRNLFDLVCAMTRFARNEYATYRDLLQTSAMRLLLPDLDNEYLRRKHGK